VKNGEVNSILNKVFVKETKETVLEKPSGISLCPYLIIFEELQKSYIVKINK